MENEWNYLWPNPFPNVIHNVQVWNHSNGFVGFHSKMGGMHIGLRHIL
jgi:hypothetical protein